MKREDVLERKAELERLREDCAASFHKIVGAIEDCEYWLMRLEEVNDGDE